MNAKISNRAPGPGNWYQIEVSGRHPAGRNADGTQREQVIDPKALRSMVDTFNRERSEAGENWGGILVDADHLSHDLNKKTEAMGWLQELQLRAGQLWGRLDLTDIGEAAVLNKRYKFFSTEYAPEDLEQVDAGTVRPLRISGLTFTNRPNNRGGKPISNRAGYRHGRDNENETNTNDMQIIATELGLSAEATEEDILAAIVSLKAQAADGEAEAVMNRYKDRIPADKRDEVKAELIKNRANGLEKILAFAPAKPSEAPEKIHNRATASTPDPVEKTLGKAKEEEDTAKAKTTAAAIRNRAGEIKRTESIPFSQAFGRAQAELS